MKALIRFAVGPAFAGAFLLTACGSQSGPPQFVQAFGAVESPCAVQAAPSTVVQHCTADVLLQNQGGEGYGHLTVVVQMKDARSTSAAPLQVRCGSSIPDTPAGGYADIACSFDLPPGQSVTTYPIVQSIDFVGASSGGSSSSDTSGLATLVITAATALIALAALVLVVSAGRREGATQSEVAAPPVQQDRDVRSAERRPARRDDPNTEYDLPQLPR